VARGDRVEPEWLQLADECRSNDVPFRGLGEVDLLIDREVRYAQLTEKFADALAGLPRLSKCRAFAGIVFDLEGPISVSMQARSVPDKVIEQRFALNVANVRQLFVRPHSTRLEAAKQVGIHMVAAVTAERVVSKAVAQSNHPQGDAIREIDLNGGAVEVIADGAGACH